MSSSDIIGSVTQNKTWQSITSRIPGSQYFGTADQFLLLSSGLFILLFLVVLPLGTVAYFSFTTEFPIRDQYVFTVEHYVNLISDPDLFFTITYESAFFAAGSSLLSIGIGLIAAILEIKYFDGSRYRYFMLVPYGIPGVVGVTGWILLLGNGGLINELLMWAFSLENPPIDIFTRVGMIWVSGLHAAPIAFLLLSPAIRSVPKAIDEAALTAGAQTLTVYRKIIIPLLAPAVLSITIFLFARAISLVTVPTVLGLNKSIFTWGSAIPFLFLYGVDLNYGLALSFSVMIMIFSGILMWLYYRAVSAAEKYTTVTGTGSAEPKVYEPSWLGKKFASGFFLTYLLLGAFLPIFVIAWDSVSAEFGFAVVDISTFSLHRYVELFTNQAQGVSAFPRALRNSLILGLVVPTIAMAVSYGYSYINQGIDLPLSGFTAWLASVPLTIPSIAISLAYLVTYIRTPLYGGSLGVVLVILAMLSKEIPTGMRYTSPAITKIGKENLEMANICGYSEIPTLRKIVFPLTRYDFVAGWMHIYVTSVREVTIPLLLYTAGSEVLGAQLLFVLVIGQYKTASTLGVVLTIISTIPYILLQYYRAQYLDE